MQLVDDLCQFRNDLHRSRPGPDNPDPLPVQGNIVLPARGVERLALKRLHALDTGQLRCGEDPVRVDQVACPHGVASVGVHDPPASRFVPLGFLHRRMEQAVLIEAELFGQLLAVLEDLEPRRKFH